MIGDFLHLCKPSYKMNPAFAVNKIKIIIIIQYQMIMYNNGVSIQTDKNAIALKTVEILLHMGII